MSSSQIGPANMSQNKPQKTEKSVKKFNYFVEQQNSLCACSYRRIAKLCTQRWKSSPKTSQIATMVCSQMGLILLNLNLPSKYSTTSCKPQ
jgi:hypothetical protein